MIGFLQPLLGLAALAAAVPVILHLIRRRELRRLSFPALRYLRRAEERYAQRLRIRHLLLLAVRVLIVLLLAAAAAGPLIGRGGPTDHLPTAVAIVMDQSLSAGRLTGDQRLIDLYRERAELSLELLGPDDRVALFSGVRSTEGAVAEGPEGVRRALRESRPTAGLDQPGDALAQAVAWLRATGLDAGEVHLFTDLQRVSMPGYVPGPPTADAGRGLTVVGYAPNIESEANGAPGIPEPETAPLNAGIPSRVSVPLHWWGERAPDSSTVVRLLAGGSVVAAGESSFRGTVLLTLPAQDTGWVQGYVETDGYGLPLDDHRYFSWLVRPAPSVALRGDAGEFVARALTALENGDRLRLTASGVADVWIAAAGEGLEEAVGSGRSTVVIPPANALELPRLDFRLDRAGLPWRYEQRDASGASRVAATSSIPGLAGIEVSRSYRLHREGVAASDTVLLRLEDGEPWLVRGTSGEGAAYLLLASPLTPEATELPVSAAMVPFLDALLGVWARREVAGAAAYVGVTRLRLPARAREVRLPDGGVRSVEGGAWFVADVPGNYTITDGPGESQPFSVNAPAAESDLSRADPDELDQVLPAAEWRWQVGADLSRWRDVIFQTRRGRLAWRPLVVLLLVLSIVEAALAAAGRRRERAPAPGGRMIGRESTEASGSAVS